jgi:hypothetical protein
LEAVPREITLFQWNAVVMRILAKKRKRNKPPGASCASPIATL